MVLNPFVSGETFRSWLPTFDDVLKFVDTVEAPKFPGPIDATLAAQGKSIFEKTCAKCHGSESGGYPNRVVPIDVVEMDPARLTDDLMAESARSPQKAGSAITEILR